MKRLGAIVAALVVATLVFATDQALKRTVEGSMHPGQSTSLLPGIVHLTYVKNSGGAFGIFAGQSVVLLIGSAIAVGFVFWMLLAGGPSKLTTLGCGLILGGAAGNLLDRLATGEVTDYIDLQFWPLQNWPVFNAADAAIVLGAAALLLSATFRSSSKN